MIVRSVEERAGSQYDVGGEGWRSIRLLLASDNMGFSLHVTTITEGAMLRLWYQRHLEAVFCIEGEGRITDLETEETHRISPGVVYALDRNDRHVLCAETPLKLVCVFNPPCVGEEVHDASGSY